MSSLKQTKYDILTSISRTYHHSSALSKIADVYTEFEKVEHMQYFSFRSLVSGLRPPIVEDDGTGVGGAEGDGPIVESIVVRYVVANACDVSFPDAWPGSSVCYTDRSLDMSDDGHWRRNEATEYADGALTWTHSHAANGGSTFFSYWPPYTYCRHLRLVSDCSARISAMGSACSTYNPVIESLGQTLEGREIECLSIGNGRLTAWVQHRQHPGETMAGE
jgi:hypothetical protein